MRRFKGLIFDFNGVLLLDQHLHDAMWKKVAAEIIGREVSEDEIKNIFHGRTNRSVLEYLFKRPLVGDELELWVTKKELAYQALARTVGAAYTLAPGATKLLDALRQRNIPYTIATSSPTMNIGFFNEMLGLDRWFDMQKIVCDDETFPGKPAPDVYVKASHVLSLKPEDCVVIEDASSGIAAAHSAGIGHIIAIGPKESHQSLQKIEGVSETIERLDEVDISRLFG
ncbi:MAG: HAD family phosphatase [bacterium]|nr:HAD family phosphatase [bacterium]